MRQGIEQRPVNTSEFFPEKTTFPPKIFLPTLVLVERTWENRSEDEQRIFKHVLRGESKGEKEMLRGITESLLTRISWLVPPQELKKISQALPFVDPDPSSPELGSLIRYQYILDCRFGIGGEKKTYESLAQELAISRERARQLETVAKRKVLAKLGATRVWTIAGERTLLDVLSENLKIVLEEIAEKGKIPSYQPAPEEIWLTVQFLSETAKDNPGLKKELEKEIISVSLLPPYDFFFVRQVLVPLAKMEGKMGTPYFTNSIFGSFFSLVEQFRERFADEMPVTTGGLRWLLGESEKKVVLLRKLTPADFGEGPQATRVYNALARAGISSTEVLLRKSPKDLYFLRQLGKKGLAQVREFLQDQYPEEKLTRDLERFLQQQELADED